MKHAFLRCLFFLILTSGQAQILISPFGGMSANANQSISYSGGETNIATIGNEDLFITQGFQQHFMPSTVNNINMPSHINNNGETFSLQKLILGGDDYNIQTLSHFLIYDVSGRIIYQKKKFKLIELQEWWTSSFTGRSLSSGIYFYFIEYEELGQTQIKTGSITKI